jgi:hypothetical protein
MKHYLWLINLLLKRLQCLRSSLHLKHLHQRPLLHLKLCLQLRLLQCLKSCLILAHQYQKLLLALKLSLRL